MLAALLAAALIGFVLVVLLISLLRRHRTQGSRPQRSVSPADPWIEAGRRAHVEPSRPDRDDSQESDP